MKHKVIMIPIGFERLSQKYWPKDSKVLGYVTEAALTGTLWKDKEGNIEVMKGLLAEDETFVIEHCQPQLLERLVPILKSDVVYKRLEYGKLEYPIKAKLIFFSQPFVPSENIKSVFEIEEVK